MKTIRNGQCCKQETWRMQVGLRQQDKLTSCFLRPRFICLVQVNPVVVNRLSLQLAIPTNEEPEKKSERLRRYTDTSITVIGSTSVASMATNFPYSLCWSSLSEAD